MQKFSIGIFLIQHIHLKQINHWPILLSCSFFFAHYSTFERCSSINNDVLKNAIK
jgi:hypothetical protein